MKCNKCGTDFEGKFCPECGFRAEFTEESDRHQGKPSKHKREKKKKPFYLRWWFVLLVIIGIFVVKGKVDDFIRWNDIALGDNLPSPPSKLGEVHTNSSEAIWLSLDGVSNEEFNQYLESCREMGFSVDEEKTSSSYKAYNIEGYYLRLSHNGDELSIRLDVPLVMGSITWPNSTAGNLLPAPKSNVGKFEFERDTSFFVYIGNTSKADYEDYIATCSDYGFHVNYNKGDNFYQADNGDGWHISLKYEGNSTMSIRIDEPDIEEEPTELTSQTETTEVEEDTISTTASTEATTAPTTVTTEATESELVNGMRPEFKEAMDAYEAFYAEYCDFWVEYEKEPTNLKLIGKYSELMKKAVDMDEAFAKWEDEDLNNEELKYYIDVNSRVMQKMVDVMGE